MAINRIENESVVVRGKNQYARAELLSLYDSETFTLETGKTPLLWYPVTRGEMYVSWLQKGHVYTIDQLVKVMDVMRWSHHVDTVGYEIWAMFTERVYLYQDIIATRALAREELRSIRGAAERVQHYKAFLALTRYYGNGRGVLCNECYSVLNVEELSRYPLQWQYSGDMYCGRHETREKFL